LINGILRSPILLKEKNQIEKELAIRKLREIKEYLRKEYGVKKIGFFGSVVRNEQSESSDIDVLIEIQEEALSLIKYMKLKFFLEEILGRKVDLVLNRAIKPRLRERILKEVIYV
jgi:predicted nucleotidyltransferase